MSSTSSKQIIKLPPKNVFSIKQINTILFYDFAPDFRTKGEKHDSWEIVYVDRGEIIVNADGKESILRQGEIVFHMPGEFHSHRCDGTHGASVFIMSFVCTSSAMKYYMRKTAKVPSELISLMKRLFDECLKTFSVSESTLTTLPDAPIGGLQLTRIYLEEFLIRMMRSEEKKMPAGVVFTSHQPLDSPLAEKICEYLSEHIYDRVTLDDLSEEFHFGKSHLCDIFKKAQNDTIVNYHLKLKMAEAKRLLREEKLSVSEVSERLGFDSPAYFSRIFHKITGMSPRSFRGKLINSATVYLEKQEQIK